MGMPLGIVLGAAFRVGQNLVGLVDVLKLQVRARRGIAIGMVAPGQAPEGRVDLRSTGRGSNLEYRVIFELSANEWRHDESLFLPQRRVVTLTSPDLVLLVIGKNLNSVILAIGLQVRRLVGDGVLTAQLVLNLRKSVGDVLDLEREKGAAAGLFGKVLEHLVALQFLSTGVGGDGVNNDFGLLRHLDGFFARDPALVVVAIAEQNDGAAGGQVARVLGHDLIAASGVDGVVHGGPAARTQHAHTLGKRFGAVGESLGDFGGGVKAHHEGLIVLGADDLVEELDRGILLELEAVANRVAGIDQQPHAQRQVGFAAEGADRDRRLVVIEHAEVILLEVVDELAALIGDVKQ